MTLPAPNSQTRPAEAQSTYRLSPRRRSVLATFALLFLAGPMLVGLNGYLANDLVAINSAAFLAFIGLPLAIFFLFFVWFPRLRVSRDGLLIRGTFGFAEIDLPWSAIERLSLRPSLEAVILREPLQTPSARRWRQISGTYVHGAAAFDDEERSLIDQSRYVSIAAFAWWFDHGDLLSDIRKYAPALVHKFETDREIARHRYRVDFRAIGVTFVLLGIFLTAALLLGMYAPGLFQGETGHRLDRILQYGAQGAFLLSSASCLHSSYKHFRSGIYGSSLFWLVLALIQLTTALSLVPQNP